MKDQFILVSIIVSVVLLVVFVVRVQAKTSRAIPWEIKGVAYNPTAIGTDQLDAGAPDIDIPHIAALGANTISTYNLGKFEWENYSNVTTGEEFYKNLYPIAEEYNLKIIVGYFSNQTIDWTDTNRVAHVTTQYQDLVLQAKNRRSTLIYLIGNEVFGKFTTEAQKIAYAKWIGQMTDWTHSVDPNHPVTYGDDAAHSGLELLKLYAPSLDIYSFNNYEWETEDQLSAIISTNANLWPGKSLLLLEWGVDSWDVDKWTEDEMAQANRIAQLSGYIKQVYASANTPFLGGVLFEYSDQWDKVGSVSSRDPDHDQPWLCLTCFDHSANEDFWGIAQGAERGASNRVKKAAYSALQRVWGGTNMPKPCR